MRVDINKNFFNNRYFIKKKIPRKSYYSPTRYYSKNKFTYSFKILILLLIFQIYSNKNLILIMNLYLNKITLKIHKEGNI